MRPRHLLTAVLCALAAYPLSVGPYSWWINHRFPPRDIPPWAATFYGPIGWFCEHAPAFDHALGWYTALWTPKPLDDF